MLSSVSGMEWRACFEVIDAQRVIDRRSLECPGTVDHSTARWVWLEPSSGRGVMISIFHRLLFGFRLYLFSGSQSFLRVQALKRTKRSTGRPRHSKPVSLNCRRQSDALHISSVDRVAPAEFISHSKPIGETCGQ